jgi:hypothetical protein
MFGRLGLHARSYHRLDRLPGRIGFQSIRRWKAEFATRSAIQGGVAAEEELDSRLLRRNIDIGVNVATHGWS